MTELALAELTTTIDAHLAAYAEPDVDRRRALLESAWSPDGVLVDPPMDGAGLDGISDLADAVLQHYPDHRFERTSAVDAHHDVGRYAWALVAPGGEVAVTGLDVVQVGADGRLRSIHGFFGELGPRD